MPGFIETCKELFDKEDLYEILNIRRDATSQEVKKGYHKLSLTVHPDRVDTENKEEATRKFQTLGRIYSILSDKDRRAAYDETGDVDDEDDFVKQDRDWYDYWRLLFGRVTFKDIEDYKQKYQGSEEEMEDLKSAYLESEGDMDVIMDSVLFADLTEEGRLTDLLKDLIKKKDLPAFPKFTYESKKKKSRRREMAESEAAEAEEERAKLGLDGQQSSLEAMIQSRQKSRAAGADNFLADLEAKYAQPAKKAKNTKPRSQATGKSSQKKKT